jgi:ubiquinone/menaquinone biosynthesis C-methylase UbiE
MYRNPTNDTHEQMLVEPSDVKEGRLQTTFQPFPSPPETVSSLPTPEPYHPDEPIRKYARYEEDIDFDAMRRSPSPSGQSVASITPSTFASSFQYMPEFGRTYNSRGDTYILPADTEENERLDIQHTVMKLCRSNNYCGPVKEVLAYDPRYQKSILDLGCGTAIWAREMAMEFPHCEVVGVDLVPVQPKPLPPNLRIELDDINLSMEHFYNSFDLIHGRMIASGIRDYRSFLVELSRVLRPGGMVLLTEIIQQSCDENRNPINPFIANPTQPSGSNSQPVLWSSLFLSYLKQAVANKGGTADAPDNLEWWLKEEELGFQEVTVDDVWVPIGRWSNSAETPDESRANLAGELCKRDYIAFIKAAGALLISSGLPESFVRTLQESTLKELDHLDPSRRICVRFRSVWARKRVS